MLSGVVAEDPAWGVVKLRCCSHSDTSPYCLSLLALANRTGRTLRITGVWVKRLKAEMSSVALLLAVLVEKWRFTGKSCGRCPDYGFRPSPYAIGQSL